eukprot:CAMPEP_0194200142 /NCGR_PEP_ID=MMETSP0156-20130528/880_1 /TAXON_ID=33649 /ORGANISM="Thalassionema nitzschioides, Strain L26-B" /LENGTH=270 /DNA_ID=CAMNT_0038925109 /DNA_START=38 /DNA_END=850 /DNA_ORIENTATION=-
MSQEDYSSRIFTLESALTPAQLKRNEEYVSKIMTKARNNLEIAEDVKEEDLISTTFELMKSNPSKKNYTNGFFLLSCLTSARNERREEFEKVMCNDVIKLSVKVTKNLIANKPDQSIPTAPSVIQHMFYCLQNLVSSKSKEYVVSSDIIPMLIGILKKEEDIGILKSTLDLITTLLMANADKTPKPLKFEITRQIMNEQGMEAIVKVITDTEKRSQKQHEQIFGEDADKDDPTPAYEKALEMKPLDDLFSHATSCLMGLSTVRQLVMSNY